MSLCPVFSGLEKIVFNCHKNKRQFVKQIKTSFVDSAHAPQVQFEIDMNLEQDACHGRGGVLRGLHCTVHRRCPRCKSRTSRSAQ